MPTPQGARAELVCGQGVSTFVADLRHASELLPTCYSPFMVNTDFVWFSHFLHRAEPPDDVDFWQPSPHGFKAIPPGAPFFFLAAHIETIRRCTVSGAGLSPCFLHGLCYLHTRCE